MCSSDLTSTDLIAYSDNATVVTHDRGATAGLTETLPTATTLGNPAFIFSYSNQSSHSDTITPTTWTIGGSSSLTVGSGVWCRIKINPNLATDWLSDCANVGSTTFEVNGTPLSSSSTVNFLSGTYQGLTISVANSSAGNVQLGGSGTLNNAGLTNSTITIQGATCTLGGSCLATPTSDKTGQSASFTSTTIDGISGGGGGPVNLRYYADVNTACSTGSNSVTFTFTWTDASGNRSLTTGPLGMGTSGTSTYLSGTIPLYVAASSAVAWSSTVTGSCTTGTSTYDAHALVGP